MAYTRLDFKPGIDKENTPYANEGQWVDSDKIRFRSGRPEKIDGWTASAISDVLGACRLLKVWRALDGTIYTGIATHNKLYVESGGATTDITPIRETQALTDAFTTTTGSNSVTVSDTGHGAGDGDFVTFSGATATGGVPSDDLNQEFEITLLDSDSYEITVDTTATSDATGGGSSIEAEYQINVGEPDQLYAYGFGAGAFGSSTWGTPRSDSNVTLNPRTWSADNWGEDFIACPQGGAVYVWDASFPSQRAERIEQAPSEVNYIIITADRHLVCLGCNEPGNDASNLDAMRVRWCDQEDYTDWVPQITNTAGDRLLTGGTRIQSAAAIEGQNVIWTDENVYSMQYIGPPYTFGFQQVGTATGIISPNAWVSYNNAVYWIGADSFYMYSGGVSALPCSVQRFIFDNITQEQTRKVFAVLNRENHEITWFYPTATVESTRLNRAIGETDEELQVATTAGFRDFGTLEIGGEKISYSGRTDTRFLNCVRGVAGTTPAEHENRDEVLDSETRAALEPCRYATYNVLEKLWWVGRMERCAWIDKGALKQPLAVNRKGEFYEHEFGNNADNDPLVAYVESADFDIGDGDKMMFVRRFVPDFFVDSGSVNVRMRSRYYPQSPQRPEIIGNVDENSDRINVRIRGRQMAFRIESNDRGDRWRYGSARIDIQPDGRR